MCWVKITKTGEQGKSKKSAGRGTGSKSWSGFKEAGRDIEFLIIFEAKIRVVDARQMG